MINRNTVFILLQKLVPQHGLSRVVGKLATSRFAPLKNRLIAKFIKHFRVNMNESLIEDYRQFEHFNAFFTRALKPDARPICQGDKIACPADGNISAFGAIAADTLLQAKHHKYTLSALLGGNQTMAKTYLNGRFMTVYLSPKDYHRVHMPLDGVLQSTTYVPGTLFSVNQTTTESIPDLFARNERLICEFESPQGPLVLILVGAMIVAGIETVWGGTHAPFKPQPQLIYQANPEAVSLKKGDEMGRFKLGSTVIMLFPENRIDWNPDLSHGMLTKMGQPIGCLANPEVTS